MLIVYNCSRSSVAVLFLVLLVQVVLFSLFSNFIVHFSSLSLSVIILFLVSILYCDDGVRWWWRVDESAKTSKHALYKYVKLIRFGYFIANDVYVNLFILKDTLHTHTSNVSLLRIKPRGE